MVSVIMPAWQASGTIGESIESVIAQTYKNWELIVIAEDEESAIVAEQYKDERIKIIRNKARLGVAKSRNRGIAESRNAYLAFLDADDIWRRDKLQKQVEVMSGSSSNSCSQEMLDADISFTASSFIDSSGSPFSYVLHAPERLTKKELLKRNLMSCSSVMVRKSVMQHFPESDKPIHEDYVVWLKILQNTDAIGIDEPLLIYRISSESKSGNRFKSGQMLFNAYREAGYGCVASVAMTARYAVHSVTKRMKLRESE